MLLRRCSVGYFSPAGVRVVIRGSSSCGGWCADRRGLYNRGNDTTKTWFACSLTRFDGRDADRQFEPFCVPCQKGRRQVNAGQSWQPLFSFFCSMPDFSATKTSCRADPLTLLVFPSREMDAAVFFPALFVRRGALRTLFAVTDHLQPGQRPVGSERLSRS